MRIEDEGGTRRGRRARTENKRKKKSDEIRCPYTHYWTEL
jgi:hypothetical protein